MCRRCKGQLSGFKSLEYANHHEGYTSQHGECIIISPQKLTYLFMSNDASRRKFLRDSALAATGFFIVPRHVLGKGYVAPSDKLNIGAIGAGGKGGDDIAHFFKSGHANIVALCD